MRSITSPWRCQLVTCISAVSRLVSRVSRSGVHCTDKALAGVIVMRREEGELRFHHGAAFDGYAKAVPLFVPRIRPAKLGQDGTAAFSLAQYKKNREYRAAIGFSILLVVLVVEWYLRLLH